MTELENTVIENHRRTTAAITATTNSVAAATAEFRRDAKENYPSLISTIKGNGERTDRLSANTKVIIDNTDTISRIGKKYSDLYRADQWQSQEMSQITTNYEDVLEKISTTQRSVSSQVAKAQQNLLETSELLKRISSK